MLAVNWLLKQNPCSSRPPSFLGQPKFVSVFIPDPPKRVRTRTEHPGKYGDNIFKKHQENCSIYLGTPIDEVSVSEVSNWHPGKSISVDVLASFGFLQLFFWMKSQKMLSKHRNGFPFWLRKSKFALDWVGYTIDYIIYHIYIYGIIS